MRAKLIVGIVLISLSSGCGWWRKSAPVAEADAATVRTPDAIELYLSRSNLSSTEFEQYKLSAGKLFIECGKIVAGRATPETQALEDASADLLEAAKSAAAEITANDAAGLEKPGDNSGLADPGLVRLTLAFDDGIETIRTSLDSVTEPDSSIEREIHSLAVVLRGAASESPCGNTEFYGLGSGTE